MRDGKVASEVVMTHSKAIPRLSSGTATEPKLLNCCVHSCELSMLTVPASTVENICWSFVDSLLGT